MPSSDTTTTSSAAVTVTAATAPSGRLAVLTAYAVAATAIPLPFLPDRVLTSIRGAVIHDVVSRHGLSLTSDARSILAEPGSEHRTRLVRAAEGVVRQLIRRLRTLSALDSIARAVEVYALGLLVDRYIQNVRSKATVRMHLEEARRVREVIDKAVLRALSPSLRPSETTLPDGLEDLRNEFTRWIDAVLLTSAALPSYVERRLEAAFDQVIAETPGIRDG
jgi:hypothetical protein